MNDFGEGKPKAGGRCPQIQSWKIHKSMDEKEQSSVLGPRFSFLTAPGPCSFQQRNSDETQFSTGDSVLQDSQHILKAKETRLWHGVHNSHCQSKRHHGTRGSVAERTL